MEGSLGRLHEGRYGLMEPRVAVLVRADLRLLVWMSPFAIPGSANGHAATREHADGYTRVDWSVRVHPVGD